MKDCKYCGIKDINDGGKEKLHYHHILGRNNEKSEDIEWKIYLCPEHHNISECRSWIQLPFTVFSIQGYLFDLYLINNGDIEYIISLIENEKKYKNLWKSF